MSANRGTNRGASTRLDWTERPLKEGLRSWTFRDPEKGIFAAAMGREEEKGYHGFAVLGPPGQTPPDEHFGDLPRWRAWGETWLNEYDEEVVEEALGKGTANASRDLLRSLNPLRYPTPEEAMAAVERRIANFLAGAEVG